MSLTDLTMDLPYRDPLIPGEFYHFYNRANSQRDKLFFQERNYDYFLRKWNKYMRDSMEVWSYCLIPNHFHFLVRMKSDPHLPPMESFRRFAITYAKAINKQEGRRGSLFQECPKHLRVATTAHLLHLIRYIHNNPVHHGIRAGMHEWQYSSYLRIARFEPQDRFWPIDIEDNKVLELFGGVEAFVEFHSRGGEAGAVVGLEGDV